MNPRARAIAVVATLAALCAGVATADAQGAGATYTPLKCHQSQREGGVQTGEPDGSVRVEVTGQYTARDLCTQGDWRYQLEPSGTSYNRGTASRLIFTAPAATEIAGVSMQIDARTRDGHWAEMAVLDRSGARSLLFRAPNEPGGYRTLGPYSGSWSQVVVELRCESPPCRNQSETNAHAWVRNVEVRLRDLRDPVIAEYSGSILGAGWLRGAHSLSTAASDPGSGLLRVVALANGGQLAQAASTCRGALTWPYARIFVPCPYAGELRATLNTRAAPFRDGANELSVRATDWAGNTASTPARTVLIDNRAPTLAFADAQRADDPELIRASTFDEHSGLREGSWSVAMRPVGGLGWTELATSHRAGALLARVDSASYEPGRWEFRARVADLAGNEVETQLRANGEPMRLEFPLRAKSSLSAQLEPGGAARQSVPYGTASSVAGRLVDARERPLEGELVRVVERFGDGALIRERVSEVRTDDQGRWTSRLPAGPSRSVSAHFDGTTRYLDDAATAGELAVRARARLRPSRRRVPEGESVIFFGRVGRLGARIPVGGKLVEIQVRQDKGRWVTVRRPLYTDARGRFRLRYRFRRYYPQDAVFQFRARALRESDWPYGAATSRRLRLVVVAR